MIMKAALLMSGSFHTPIDFWLGLTLPEFFSWTTVASNLEKKRGQ
jgi:hypothetical protein